MSTQGLSINACRACRAQHKKCDRKLPHCSRCARNKRECAYNDTIKRGPKSSSKYNQPYPELSVKVTRQQQPQSAVFSLDFGNLKFIPQERLFRAMSFVENEMTETPNEETPDVDDLALIYSIKACILRAIGSPQAPLLFEKARALVMTKFDQILKNFLLASCSLFLGTYCFIDNDSDRTTFFFENVKTFLERNTESNESTDLLRLLYDDVARMLIGDNDMERVVKNTIAQLYSIQQYENNTDSSHITSIQRVTFSEIDKVQHDLKYNTDTYELTTERIEYLNQVFDQLYAKMDASIPKHTVDLKRYASSLTMQGAICQRCFRYGQTGLAVQAADRIAQMTTLPTFKDAFLSLGAVVSLAANMHMYTWVKFQESDIKGNALNCLKLELDALLFIQGKNKIVGASLNDVIQTVSYTLRTAQEQILLNNMFTHANKQRMAYNFANTLDNFKLAIGTPTLAIQDTSKISDEEALDVVDQFFLDFIE